MDPLGAEGGGLGIIPSTVRSQVVRLQAQKHNFLAARVPGGDREEAYIAALHRFSFQKSSFASF